MLREATLDDMESVKILAEAYISDSGESLTISVLGFAEYYIRCFADPDRHLYVLEHEDTLVGFAVINISAYMFNEKIARYEWFYIHPCMRGTGAALKLAEFLRDLSVRQGASIIVADTIIARFAGVFRNMFKKLGFEQPGYTMVYRS